MKIAVEHERDAPEPGEPARAGSRRLVARAALGASAAFCAVTLAISAWDQFGPPAWRPRIAATPQVFDLGQRRVGEVVNYEFTLSNVGGQELIVSKATATCGCVTPRLSETRIPPGYAIRLPVQISLDRADDKLQKLLFVESNDPVRSKLVLSIVGQVVAN